MASDQIAAVVLAGGFGTRVKHLLGNLPKPMAPVAGRPFLEWIVRYLAAQNIRRVILSTGHRAEIVEAHFKTQPVPKAMVSCVPEVQPLGTAGGFLNAIRNAAPQPPAWLVLNGDSLALASLGEMTATLEHPGISGAVLGVRLADASRYGAISQNAAGDLDKFDEKRPGARLINAGVYLFKAEAIRQFPQRLPLSFEMDVFPALIAAGARLKVCAAEAPFLDIGTPESLPLAEKFIRDARAWFA
ncbi:MAG: nucleotidyltransferase family protein, partial [Verrucomicrobia bacterium]|nr:nucleotidyltransferase family protein [Verrucomicrobiota bacterium]